MDKLKNAVDSMKLFYSSILYVAQIHLLRATFPLMLNSKRMIMRNVRRFHELKVNVNLFHLILQTDQLLPSQKTNVLANQFITIEHKAISVLHT